MTDATKKTIEHVTPIKSAIELLGILSAVPENQFMSFVAETSIASKMTAPNRRKWGERIFKRARVQTRSYVDYKRSSEIYAKSNGLPAPDIAPRKHGINLKGTPFVITSSKANPTPHMLLKVDIINTKYEYVDKTTDENLDKDFVHSLFTGSALKKRPVSKTGRIYVEYGINTIRTLSANGKKYVLANGFKYDNNLDLQDKYEELIAVQA